MRYTLAGYSDAGKVKKNNQDAIALRQAVIDGQEAVLAVLCDGMGGFEQGEVASSSLVMAYVNWFETKFLNFYVHMDEDTICASWEKILVDMNKRIYDYGVSNSIKIGTTLTIMLIWKDRYHILNVGDCRAYEFADEGIQITKDHSVVAREIEEGRLTKEEARVDSRRDQLLKCVGGMPRTSADFFVGKIKEQAVYMLCCDGVRTKVNDEELFYYFHPTCMTTKEYMDNNIRYVFELNKLRDETDNMSILLVKENNITYKLEEESGVRIVYSEEFIPSNILI